MLLIMIASASINFYLTILDLCLNLLFSFMFFLFIFYLLTCWLKDYSFKSFKMSILSSFCIFHWKFYSFSIDVMCPWVNNTFVKSFLFHTIFVYLLNLAFISFYSFLFMLYVISVLLALYKFNFFSLKLLSFLTSPSFMNFLFSLFFIFTMIVLFFIYLFYFQPPLYALGAITYNDFDSLALDLSQEGLASFNPFHGEDVTFIKSCFIITNPIIKDMFTSYVFDLVFNGEVPRCDCLLTPDQSIANFCHSYLTSSYCASFENLPPYHPSVLLEARDFNQEWAGLVDDFNMVFTYEESDKITKKCFPLYGRFSPDFITPEGFRRLGKDTPNAPIDQK